jgi:hypothetical protein
MAQSGWDTNEESTFTPDNVSIGISNPIFNYPTKLLVGASIQLQNSDLKLNFDPNGNSFTYGIGFYNEDRQFSYEKPITGTVVYGYEGGGLGISGFSDLQSPDLVLVWNNQGRVGIGTHEPQATLHVAGHTKTTSIQITTLAGLGKVLTSDEEGNASWQTLTLPEPSTNNWTLSGNNIFNTLNNVGIGTNSPSERFEVMGKTKTTQLQVTTLAGVGDRMLVTDADGNIKAQALPNTTAQVWTVTGSGAVYNGNVRLPQGSEIYFNDNGQIRSFDNNHRILFRRTENKIEIREWGDIIFSSGSTGGETANMVINKDAQVIVKNALFTNKLNTREARISNLTSTGTRLVVADADGNLSIPISPQTQPIVVTDAVRITGTSELKLGDNASTGEKIYSPRTNRGYSTEQGNNGIVLHTAHNDRMVIRNDGWVRIHSLGGTGTRMVVADAKGNLSTQAIPSGGGSNTWAVNGSNMNYTAGNIGIGKAAGTERVEVQGNMRVFGKIATKEVCVNPTAVFCDYVFEPDYKLRNLEELKVYIQNNKHLPGVPSASYIKENGYNLTDMDRYTMEKVEELYLYIFQLENRIKQLEK